MTRLLGDANPELAKRYGLDLFQREQLETALGDADSRVKLVLLQDPPPRPDGKTDPIAYLPPAFRTYGIVDRAHRHRVKAGEAWFVEIVDRSGAFFLVPLARFDVGELGHYLPEVLAQVAQHIARDHPDILKDSMGEEKAKELRDLRAKLMDREQELLQLREEAGLLRAERERLEAELAKAREAAKAGPGSASPGRAPGSTPATASPVSAAPASAAKGSATAPASPGAPAAAQAAPPSAAAAFDPRASREGIAVRERGDVLASPLFMHAAYESHFTLDLTRLHLRPSRNGHACYRGTLEVPGLARVDPEPAPRRYPVTWSDEAGAFVVLVGEGAGVAAAGGR